MSIWFFLWLLLSGALLFFMGWNLLILYRQKKAWKVFAAKRKLRYRSTAMMSAPEISGVMNDFTVSMFTGEHMRPDQRSSRKLTAIEVNLTSVMPFEIAIASGGMVDLARELNFKEEIRPDLAGWDKGWVVYTQSRTAAEAYLTPERLQALVGLLKEENAWVIFIARAKTTLLRLDTPLPLDTPVLIDKLCAAMTSVARELELKGHEDKILMAEASRKTAHQKTVALHDQGDVVPDFALEDDPPTPREPS